MLRIIVGGFACLFLLATGSPLSAQTDTSYLYIGNSFTMVHGLPTIVKALLEEGDPGSPVNTEIVGYGGRNLFQHWECFRSYDRLAVGTATEADIAKQNEELNALANQDAEPAFYTAFKNELSNNSFYAKFQKTPKFEWAGDQKAIKSLAIPKRNNWMKNKSTDSQKFDYLVLQSWLDVGDTPEVGYFKYAAKFAEAAKSMGAKPVLYLTAPYSHNAEPVTKAVARDRAVGECKAASAFAGTINAIVVPVPLAITLAQESTEPVARTLTFRYKKDFHPNNTMAYLTACTFYAALTGKSPEGLKFNTVSYAQAGKLQNIHGEAITKANKEAAVSTKVDPDGEPMETVFDDETRLFLQRTAWQAVELYRSEKY